MRFQRRASAFGLGRRSEARMLGDNSEDDMSYCTVYDWTPTLASVANASDLTNGASCAAFIGEGGSTTVGVVMGSVQGLLTPDAAAYVEWTATLPATADEVVFVSGYAAGSGDPELVIGSIAGSTMTLYFTSPDTSPWAFFVDFTYRTGAA